MRISFKKIIITNIFLILLASSICNVLGFNKPIAASTYNQSQIDSKIYKTGGSTLNTLKDWDRNCYNRLSNELGSGNKSGAFIRTAVNESIQYREAVWASLGGDPSNLLVKTVISPGSTVNLQINMAEFLCAALADNSELSGYNRDSSYSVATYLDRVNNFNIDSKGFKDSLAGRYYINNVALSETSFHYNGEPTVSHGSISTNFIGKKLNIKKDNNSRFWFSLPTNFTYTAPSTILASGQEISVNFRVRQTVRYGDQWSCARPSSGQYLKLDNNYDHNDSKCPDQELTIRFRIEPPSNWTIRPGVSISETKAFPGQTVTWTHTARNNGPTSTNKIVTASAKGHGSPSGAATLPSGSASGSEISFTSTFTIPNDASVGTKYCRRTNVAPKNQAGGNEDSDEVCVEVKPKWQLQPNTEIRNGVASWKSTDIIAIPGDTIEWRHEITNEGPHANHKKIEYWYKNGSDFDRVVGGIGLANFSGQKQEVAIGEIAKNSTKSFGSNLVNNTATFTIEQDDVGKKFCRKTEAKPKNQEDNSTVSSGEVCVNVPYNYNLIPSITLGANTVTPGQVIRVDPKVNNEGPTKSHDVNWKIKVYKNGSLIEDNFQFGKEEFYTGVKTLGNYNYTNTAGLSFGDDICFSLWLSRKTHESIVPIESDQKCAKVGKTPKVQVWGGDIWADKKVAGAMSFTSGKQFGSWAEYGILSKGSISNFGSAGVMPSDSADSCGFSWLSFTNFGCPDSIGGYNFNRVVPNIGNMFTNPSDESENNLNLSALVGGVYELNSGDIINVDGGDIDVDKSIVLLASGKTVKINGDIKYSEDTITDLNKIPQVVIIAKDIDIKDSVEQIDAWLIAENEINTCYNSTFNEIKGNICNKQLKINGPIRAKKINLYRTYGSNNIYDQGSPAEIINYRADAILWAINQSNNTNSGIPSIKSTYIIEQPVRF